MIGCLNLLWLIPIIYKPIDNNFRKRFNLHQEVSKLIKEIIKTNHNVKTIKHQTTWTPPTVTCFFIDVM